MGVPFAKEQVAILFSLIARTEENLVATWTYLPDVFTRLPEGLTAQQMKSCSPTAGFQPTPIAAAPSPKTAEKSETQILRGCVHRVITRSRFRHSAITAEIWARRLRLTAKIGPFD